MSSPRVVVCGGGIVGVSCAYYLAKRGCLATIVERREIAAAASGKAGGFLALDWNDRLALGPLSRVSFALHDELARELGADDIGYRRLDCIAVAVDERETGAPVPRKLAGLDLAWGGIEAKGTRQLGDKSSVAQVHPHRLTNKMAESVVAAGGTVRIDAVTAVRPGPPCARVELASGETLEADAVVLAMGPWTDQIGGGLALPKMLGQKYHSLRMQIGRVLDQAVFFQGRGDVELYPRPDGEVYVTGYTGDAPVVVRELPGEVEVRESKLAPHEQLARSLSTDLKDARRTGAQSCYLPLTQDGVPAIGAVAPGVYVGAGHTCWGILNGPATGKALAELVLDGRASCVSLEAFSPTRFAAGGRRQRGASI